MAPAASTTAGHKMSESCDRRSAISPLLPIASKPLRQFTALCVPASTILLANGRDFSYAVDMPYRLAFACALVLAVAVGSRAQADQNDPRLVELFDDLRKVTGYLQARTIEQEIWSIWLTASDPAVNRLMAEGVDAMAAQDFKTALADFNEITKLAPDFAEGWNKRATVLYLMGDFQGSLADVDKTLALEPRHFGALSGLGLINTALEREEEAIAAFEKALEVNPHMPGVIANIEYVKQRLKNKEI